MKTLPLPEIRPVPVARLHPERYVSAVQIGGLIFAFRADVPGDYDVVEADPTALHEALAERALAQRDAAPLAA